MKTLIVMLAACVIAATLRIDVEHGRAVLQATPAAIKGIALFVCGIVIGRYVFPDGNTAEIAPERPIGEVFEKQLRGK